MVRPLAGKPASKRAMNSFSVMERDVRFKISWLQLLVERRPLFPEPFARKLKREMAAENCRVRKSARAVR